jgi:LPXTG-site transpeptidase (sortase) family protein
MEAPKNWNEAGWYFKSSYPGSVGNLVINGHYDDNYGRLAAFGELKNINPGDKVKITDKYNKDFLYEINEVFLVSIDDPDRLSILKNTDSKRELTMITCGGVWIPGKSTYNNRLVVKGELVR